MTDEIYVSVDIETDGPVPGIHSMLSMGCCAVTRRGAPLGTFYERLKPLPEASPNPATMKWWEENKEAWREATRDPKDPAEVMPAMNRWLRSLPGKPVFAAYPAGFDFTFVYWYLIRFAGESAFGFQALDMKTLAMALLAKPYRDATKRHMPRSWFDPGGRHTHNALADATEQAHLLVSMLAEVDRRKAG
jgi:hypothetical protein